MKENVINFRNNKKTLSLIVVFLILSVFIFYRLAKFSQPVRESSEPINIVFTIDNNYALFTLLTLNSIFKNSNSVFNIFIIENGLSDFSKLWLEKYIRLNHSKITFIYKNTKNFNDCYLVNKNISYITSIAMARIFIPELLPKDIYKVIYLDSDILVVDDLKHLFNIDLKGKPLGMVLQGAEYYNDGVILMDLDKWRENEITKSLLKHYENNFAKNYKYPDQDLLNIVLHDDIFTLPQVWNVYGSDDEVKTSVAIYHYYGHNKPWWYMEYVSKGLRLYQKYWTNSFFVFLKPYFYLTGFKNRIRTQRTFIQKKMIKIKSNTKFIRIYKKSIFRIERYFRNLKEFYGF